VDPAYVYAWSNQVDLSSTMAQYQLDHGGDPRTAIDDAVKSGEQGLKVDPSFDRFLKNMAAAEVLRAEYAVRTEGDPRPAIAAAGADLDRAEQLRPDNMTTWYYRARAA